MTHKKTTKKYKKRTKKTQKRAKLHKTRHFALTHAEPPLITPPLACTQTYRAKLCQNFQYIPRDFRLGIELVCQLEKNRRESNILELGKNNSTVRTLDASQQARLRKFHFCCAAFLERFLQLGLVSSKCERLASDNLEHLGLFNLSSFGLKLSTQPHPSHYSDFA